MDPLSTSTPVILIDNGSTGPARVATATEPKEVAVTGLATALSGIPRRAALSRRVLEEGEADGLVASAGGPENPFF